MTKVTVQVAGKGGDPIARCEVNAGPSGNLSPGTAAVGSYQIGVDMGAVQYLVVRRMREGEIKVQADGPVTMETDGRTSKLKAGKTKKLAGGAQRCIVRVPV